MTTITFNCDRCKTTVTGMHTASGTAGFYVVDPGKPWAQYALQPQGPDGVTAEHFVCDRCVQSMPEYREVYGQGEHNG